MICQDLTLDETRHLIIRMQNDRAQDEDLLLKEHADEFEDAWLEHQGNSVTSMRWAMNNTLLPYRLHLIALLVEWRLHGLPES